MAAFPVSSFISQPYYQEGCVWGGCLAPIPPRPARPSWKPGRRLGGGQPTRRFGAPGRSPDERRAPGPGRAARRPGRHLPAPVPTRLAGGRPAPLSAPGAWAPTCRGSCPGPGEGCHAEERGRLTAAASCGRAGAPPGAAPGGAGGAPRALQPPPRLEPSLKSFCEGWGADFQKENPTPPQTRSK